MLELSQILFDDEITTHESVYKVGMDDVVIVHLTPTDMFIKQPETPTRHITPAAKAIETQLFIAKQLGMPYKTHREALEDYISVHWAWWERKENAATSLNPHDDTAIIKKDTTND